MPTPFVIVLDPGHGGTAAVGGSSPNNAAGPNGLLEKDLTLDIARRVASSLAGSDSRVLLTRTGDTNLSLAARAEVARANNARLFLSIHFNGFRDARVDGTEVWLPHTASQASEGFAQRVLSALLAVTRVSNRGIRREDFGVLLPGRHAPATLACLAEIAFLTNSAQARRLEGEEYRRALAAALEDVIRQYLPSQHFIHHAVRPENRIPPPVPFGLSHGAGVGVAQSRAAEDVYERTASGQSYADALQSACATGTGLANRAVRNCPLLAAAAGTNNPNFVMRWNNVPQAGGEVDVVVHFHGYAPTAMQDEPGGYAEMNLGRHIEPHSGLIEENGTTPACRPRPTLAVIPRGTQISGREYRHSFFLDNEDGLDRFLNYALTELGRELRPTSPPRFTMKRLILTAHSGGGQPLAHVLGLRKSGAPRYNPHEVHLYDATYGWSNANITAWAKRRIDAHAANAANEAGALRVLYFPCSANNWSGDKLGSQTETGARDLQWEVGEALKARRKSTTSPADLRNCYRVEQVSVRHEFIPRKFGPQMLRDPGTNLTPSPVTASNAPACCEAHEWGAHGRCNKPPASPPPAARPRAQALDRQRRHGPLPYREAVSETRLFCRQNINRWEQRIADAETRLAGGLVSRFSPDALSEFDAELSCYSMLGLDAQHTTFRGRLASVLRQINAWVFDTSRSAVAQIEDATTRNNLLRTNWGQVSYPGNAGNTAPATSLFGEMARLVPERRVPQLVPFETVDSFVVNVPGSSCTGCGADNPRSPCQLFPAANDSFVTMRTAAAAFRPPAPPTPPGQTPPPPAPGVTLHIGSAFRSARTQQQIAAANPNPHAVAQNRSAHTYGLAIDLCLSVPGLAVTEITTQPMTNLVEMYKSPVYKWMFLFGAHHGWFPYRAEPWHWEYNPPGFPERFRALVRELRAARQPARANR